MNAPSSMPLLSADAAVLLVLLPVALGAAQQTRLATISALEVLQQQLGSAILVLKIDQASHPTVVSSFQTAGLPAFVLVRQGVELWRQQGLPEGESIVPLLLSKLAPAPITANERSSNVARTFSPRPNAIKAKVPNQKTP